MIFYKRPSLTVVLLEGVKQVVELALLHMTTFGFS